MNFDSRVESLKGELIENLQGLVRIKSVEDLGGDGYPFGKGVNDCLEYCLDLSKKFGFKTVNIDKMAGYAEYGEGDEMIAILGHLDVVPEGDGWKHPPYAAEIADGKIYGRGTTDDKGPVMAALYALKVVADSGEKLDRRVRIVFGLNEETGSRGIEHYVEKGEELPVMGFTPDAEFPIINGEKGIMTASFTKKMSGQGSRRIKHLEGGMASNIVPDYAKAEIVLESEDKAARNEVKKMKDIKLTDTADGLIVEAYGKNAHGSTPEKGENAIGRLFVALSKLNLSGEYGEACSFIAEKIGMNTRGKELGIYLYDEVSHDLTLNLGVLKGNDREITVTINIRYPVTTKLDDFYGTMKANMAKCEFGEVSFGHKGPIYMAPDKELIKKLSKVYEEQTGDKTELISIGGGTYAKEMPNIVAFGPIFPGNEMVEHKPDEYIDINELIKSTCIYASAIYELAKKD